MEMGGESLVTNCIGIHIKGQIKLDSKSVVRYHPRVGQGGQETIKLIRKNKKQHVI